MSAWATSLLPSLQALGIWAYWIVGGAAMLEGFFVTGVVVPGTLIVDAGGGLVRLGTLDFFDLVWFVAAGAAAGGELGYWTGRRSSERLRRHWDPERSAAYRRAASLFRRRGGMALVLGRFLGPVAGLGPLAAALAGMEPRRFHIWNLISAVPYAFVHVGIGYAAGDVLARVGPQVERALLLLLALAIMLALIWLVSAQIRRGLPLLLAALAALRDAFLAVPAVASWVDAHPGTAAFVARRFHPELFAGLPLTALSVLFLYLAGAWADTALDLVYSPQVAETDLRLARLIHEFWSPGPIRLFGLVTQLGHWPVVLAAFAGAVLALAITGRNASLVQLAVALGGELLTVRLLKAAFGRPRPDLSYFVETSMSFPSGHATLSVAFWGTLTVILWRERILGATTALVVGTTLAFTIGFSRVYLIEHFFSDVVNGWIVGGIWLVIALTVAEWLRERGWRGTRSGRWRKAAAAGTVTLAALGAAWLAVSAEPPRTEAPATPLAGVVDPTVAAGTRTLPLETLTLTGDVVAPASVILLAPDLDAVATALTNAGWRRVDPPTITSLAHAAWADLTGRPDPTAPLLPTFWQGQPQDAGFRGAADDVELRLWDSGARAPDGTGIFLAVLSPVEDDGEAWPIGAARDSLARQLAPAATRHLETPPQRGTAITGRAWSWDGRVSLLRLHG